MTQRYRYDTGAVIDNISGEILSERQVVNRLNREHLLKNSARKQMEAMRTALKEEIDKADNEELKKALIRIYNKRLDL